MSTGSQYDIRSNAVEAKPISVQGDQNAYPGEAKPKSRAKMMNVQAQVKPVNQDSILQQYSHNLPPQIVEYKSGFQEIPPPIYNANEDVLRRKTQAKPLPGHVENDEEDLHKYMR